MQKLGPIPISPGVKGMVRAATLNEGGGLTHLKGDMLQGEIRLGFFSKGSSEFLPKIFLFLES